MLSLGTAALALLLLAGAATAARPAVSLTLPGEAAAAAADRVQSWSPPWFCHKLDCPKFEVQSKEEAFEVRQYAAATWVSTDVEAYAYALAANTGFKRLFQYIDGANHDAVKIPMTAPVRTRIRWVHVCWGLVHAARLHTVHCPPFMPVCAHHAAHLTQDSRLAAPAAHPRAPSARTTSPSASSCPLLSRWVDDCCYLFLLLGRTCAAPHAGRRRCIPPAACLAAPMRRLNS